MDFQSREWLEAVRNIQRTMNSFQESAIRNAQMYNDLALRAGTTLAEPVMRFQEFNNSMNSNMIRMLQTQQTIFLEATTTMQRFASSFADFAVDIRNNIPFEQLAAIDFSYLDEMDNVDEVELSDEMKAHIQQEIQVQLDAMNEIEEPTIATYQEFFVKLSNNIPFKYLFPILFFVFSPFSNLVSEEIQETLTEAWEDKLQIDLTGEYNATIREETFLREDSGITAPILLPQQLKVGQTIIVNTRRGSWVKIMVLVGETTYTG
ncbi:hypothetical protein [Lysinibacillus xylanilyticus]|uniref:Uncharacterized protein n=1 Tax=Lysinibacillus xylanilyticus TaxID=582475 RepID=A0A2M9QA41_9BACI|nr:hypothetical protein [Lysinibacillus xylanilyticus]PJO44938.1 hypothetical protein CWD94_04435 [Lysinibacillus xylanilyticus]